MKPFDVGELKARVRALLRRAGENGDPAPLPITPNVADEDGKPTPTPKKQ